jgi:hypothetical protein
MNRSSLFRFLACALAFAGIPQASSAPLCQPSLAFKQVQFSPMQPPTMQRKWTALVAVDAARCAANSRGRFEIVFTRLQEYGPDSESREEFMWAAPEVTVAMDFAPTEAVQDYRIGRVTQCPCAGDQSHAGAK